MEDPDPAPDVSPCSGVRWTLQLCKDAVHGSWRISDVISDDISDGISGVIHEVISDVTHVITKGYMDAHDDCQRRDDKDKPNNFIRLTKI